LANLERFESSITMPVITQLAELPSEHALPQDGKRVAALAPAQEVKRTEARPGIVRISRSEVRIATVSSSGKPATAYATYLERNFEPVVRISLARDNPTSTATRPIIRITLPQATPSRSSREVAARGPGGRVTG
jgi:lipoprotein-anchoring transpeptidase ErfK/SrfK